MLSYWPFADLTSSDPGSEVKKQVQLFRCVHPLRCCKMNIDTSGSQWLSAGSSKMLQAKRLHSHGCRQHCYDPFMQIIIIYNYAALCGTLKTVSGRPIVLSKFSQCHWSQIAGCTWSDYTTLHSDYIGNWSTLKKKQIGCMMLCSCHGLQQAAVPRARPTASDLSGRAQGAGSCQNELRVNGNEWKKPVNWCDSLQNLAILGVTVIICIISRQYHLMPPFSLQNTNCCQEPQDTETLTFPAEQRSRWLPTEAEKILTSSSSCVSQSLYEFQSPNKY